MSHTFDEIPVSRPRNSSPIGEWRFSRTYRWEGESAGGFEGRGTTLAEAMASVSAQVLEEFGDNWIFYEERTPSVSYSCDKGTFQWLPGRQYDHGPKDRACWTKR